MYVSLPLLLVIITLGGICLSWAIFEDRVQFSLLFSVAPAALLIVWVVFLGITVGEGVPIEKLWAPFWVGSFFFALIGFVIIARRAPRAIAVLSVPIFCTAVVMAPYLAYGVGDYPGSWFWDGWSYLAGGEALWRYPRMSTISNVELLYEYGHFSNAKRYIASALISIFRDILPLGGDSQASTGYFILLCVFVFACSCHFLARVVMPGRPIFQVAFVLLAAVSGQEINLIWANNFDNLLAVAIAPALAGMALLLTRHKGASLFWRFKTASLLGLGISAEIYIYPEMAPVLILVPAILLASRYFVASQSWQKNLLIGAIIATIALLALSPYVSEAIDVFEQQYAAATVPGPARPGENYFPTFFDGPCSLGALLGMYAPFEPCRHVPMDFLASGVALFFMAALVYGLIACRTRPALIYCTFVPVLGIAYYVLAQRYDYGAFKFIATNWYLFALIVIIGLLRAQSQPVKIGATSIGAIYGLMLIFRIVDFAGMVPFKSIDHFRDFRTAIPGGSIVALQITDNPLAYEWAVYYLRDCQIAPIAGHLPYYPAAPRDDPQVLSRLSKAEFMVTDSRLAGHPYGTPLWSRGAYRVYKIALPSSHPVPLPAR